jgi:hypothetical protein
VRRALLLLALGLVPLVFAGEARATNECRGLDVCISVPGPWVVVPGAPATGVTTVEFQVTCPKGSIAGGLDAILGDPTLDVHFLGTLGSPVNPGITTSRSVVFVATYARGRPTTFRPVLGCIPTSGGGGRLTTAYTPVAVKPLRPLLRRVRSIPLTGAGRQVTARCGGGERLVGFSSAVGLRTRAQPRTTLLSGVQVTTRRDGNAVVVRATRSAAMPRGVKVVVQVHLFCARGPR